MICVELPQYRIKKKCLCMYVCSCDGSVRVWSWVKKIFFKKRCPNFRKTLLRRFWRKNIFLEIFFWKFLFWNFWIHEGMYICVTISGELWPEPPIGSGVDLWIYKTRLLQCVLYCIGHYRILTRFIELKEVVNNNISS